jgi:hypothetical protein
MRPVLSWKLIGLIFFLMDSRDADADVPILKDAKAEYAKLQ